MIKIRYIIRTKEESGDIKRQEVLVETSKLGKVYRIQRNNHINHTCTWEIVDKEIVKEKIKKSRYTTLWTENKFRVVFNSNM